MSRPTPVAFLLTLAAAAAGCAGTSTPERARGARHGLQRPLALAQAPDDAPAKPRWFVDAERSLVGTWANTAARTDAIPKIEIVVEGGVLKIQPWGRTHPHDTPFGPPDPLLVLSRYSDRQPAPEGKAFAFATHKADFAMKFFTLTLRDRELDLEEVTVFTDNSGRSNRVYYATFAKRQARGARP